MAVYTQIDNPAEFFSVKIYSGSGSNTTVAHGLSGNAPDMFLIKRRNSTGGWINWNTGLTNNSYYMQWNNSDQQDNSTNNLQNTATTTTNISIGDQAFTNASGGTYVLYSWKAGGSASTNTSGSEDVELSANATSGFSVCTGTSASSGEFTFAHGLGTKVDMCIFKNKTDGGTDWVVFQSNVCDATTKYMTLGSGALATNGSSIWGAALPTTTLMGGTSGQLVTASKGFSAYNFSNRQGFLKCGTYTGNGNTDGTFVYTGFKPAFVMIKRSSSTGNWYIADNKRDTFNVVSKALFPNANSAEGDLASNTPLDFTSNGFKLRNSNLTGDTNINISGSTYIYMAFAEAPFVNSKGVPTTAR